MYFSIILLASSRLSSIPSSFGVEVVPLSPLGPSSLFKAMNIKYASPIVASTKKTVEMKDLNTKSETVNATTVTEILAIGLGTEAGMRFVPASIPSFPTFHAVCRTLKMLDCIAHTTGMEGREFRVLGFLICRAESKDCFFNLRKELEETN